MTGDDETLDRPRTADALASPELPGLIIVFSADQPLLHALPLVDGVRRLGRADGPGGPLPDATLSRQHVEVRYDGGAWIIRDLDSRNGTFVDGARASTVRATAPRCIRISNTLVLPVANVGPFVGARVQVDGERVVGPQLAAELARAHRAAVAGDTLLITGETGSGKELVARAFHAGGPRARGPFVATNCAAIPPALAERLIFGARKGAYSGADADADGYVQAAAGGVLFLDELGELDAAVQAKLLRLIETREVLPLGAVRPSRADVQICCATHRSLRERVAAGQFREDLLFRVSQATVALPSLRERLAELPWLVQAQLATLGDRRPPDARFIEQCLLRPWPGNLRELASAVRAASRERVDDRPLRLAPGAGEPLVAPAATATTTTATATATAAATAPRPAPTRDAIAAELARQGGNVAATARALGLQRTALYRLMKQLGMTVHDR